MSDFETIRRIASATRAMNTAQNPEFKLYWENVVNSLKKQLTFH